MYSIEEIQSIIDNCDNFKELNDVLDSVKYTNLMYNELNVYEICNMAHTKAFKLNFL